MSNNYTVWLINKGSQLNVTVGIYSFILYSNYYTILKHNENFSMSYLQDGIAKTIVKELKCGIAINFLGGKYMIIKMCRYEEKCGNQLCTYKHLKDLEIETLKLFTYKGPKTITQPIHTEEKPLFVQTPTNITIQQTTSPIYFSEQKPSKINIIFEPKARNPDFARENLALLLNYMEIKNLTKYCKDVNINIQGVTTKGAIIQQIMNYYNL